MINIEILENDDQQFLEIVEALARGIAQFYEPRDMYITHIDNWFDMKWLNFSGKTLGALGVWKDYYVCNENLTLPPFTPNRVLRSYYFTKDNLDKYVLSNSTIDLHVKQPSEENFQRKVAHLLPESAFLWFSGNTVISERGSIMAYLPSEGGYVVWFASLIRNEDWEFGKLRGISNAEIQYLRKAGLLT